MGTLALTACVSCVDVWQVPEEAGPEASEESDSDLDEEAALLFYRGVELKLKLKRKGKDQQVEER